MTAKPPRLPSTALPLFGEDEVATPVSLRDGPLPSYIRDHRKRLRERFLKGGESAMPDYEILELILFRAIPRRDVKPLARALLDHFGGFNAVLSASADQLSALPGVGDAVICELKVIEAAAHRLARARVLQRHVISSWNALLDYCRATMAHRPVEQFRIFYLDRKNVLIADEEQARGTVDHVPVYPREVVKRALLLNASALILVHNHPSGDATPSPEDKAVTRRLEQCGELVGITILDHIVLGRDCQSSIRECRG